MLADRNTFEETVAVNCSSELVDVAVPTDNIPNGNVPPVCQSFADCGTLLLLLTNVDSVVGNVEYLAKISLLVDTVPEIAFIENSLTERTTRKLCA